MYAVIADGPVTVEDLAREAGIDRRYAREWLEQQAAASILEVIEPDEGYPDVRFALPAAHRAVLVDPEHPSYMAGFGRALAGIGGVLPQLEHAYRTGQGVPYADYGEEFRTGQGGMNRPLFATELASWFRDVPALADLVSRPRARIADIGAGEGWSSIAMAQALPDASILSLDSDEASAVTAWENAGAAGVDIEVHVADAAELASLGPFHLVTVFEALHDMSRPVEVMASVRESLASSGAVLLMDERVADRFEGPTDEVERLMYGWSVLHCLPASRAEQPSAALGTVLRRPAVEALVRQAGFRDLEVLPIENAFFRFYLLRP